MVGRLHKIAGQRIREARKAAGKTQAELAAALGETWQQSNISDLEAGRRSLTLDNLERIAELLGVAPDDLLAERPIGQPRSR